MVKNLTISNQVYKARVYCRLSSDDGSLGDSASIQTQKLMLEKYCKDNQFSIYEIYVDDGYSGLNFNRPAFQRLLSDIEQGNVNLVITKDLSRLGGDYIQTGYYIEIFFQSKKVRYIAVNDSIDTLSDNNDIAPFKNILNDMYAKDLSKKVKSAKKQRAMKGMFISAQTPFGYEKDPLNPNHLVIDEEVAEIVREIYQLALLGKGTVSITKILTQKKTITPAAYKAKQGDTRFIRFGALRGEGGSINGVLLVCKRRIRKNNFENLFKSIIFCKTCGYRLHLAEVIRPKRENELMYKCAHHFTHKDQCPNNNSINYEQLKEVITQRIKSFFQLMKSDNDLFMILENKWSKDNTSKKLQNELAKLETKKESFIKMTSKVYQDSVLGKIDEVTVDRLLQNYQTEQSGINSKIKEIKKQLEKKQNIIHGLAKLKEEVNKYLDLEELNHEMVNALISKIIIEHKKKENGEKTQEINIVWRFVDMSI